MDSQKIIGEKIRKARLDAGLTQEQLGAKIGYSAMGVSYLEKGQRNITIDLLEKIVEHLNVSVQFLLEPLYGKSRSNASAIYARMNEGNMNSEDSKKIADFDSYIEEEFFKK